MRLVNEIDNGDTITLTWGDGSGIVAVYTVLGHAAAVDERAVFRWLRPAGDDPLDQTRAQNDVDVFARRSVR